MGLLILFIIIMVCLIFLEIFKHHITKNIFKFSIFAIIFIIMLLIASSYLDLSSFFSEDNTFVKTGAIVTEDLSEDINNIEWGEIETFKTIEEKMKNAINNILEE